MPRKFTKPLGTNVSPREYEVVRELADDQDVAVYLRKLIIEDAQRRGIKWPFETKTRGKYARK